MNPINNFLTYLGETRAQYNIDLYYRKQDLTRREHAAAHVQKTDEFHVLMNIIHELPYDAQQHVQHVYDERMAVLKQLL